MKIDTITKDFIKDKTIFADLFNQYIYGGRQVILPEQLEEQDSAEISLPYGTDGAAVPVQKFPDVKKLYTAKTDGKMSYVLYGVENQAEPHQAMVIRNSLYDALAYAGQAEEAAKSYRRAMKKSPGKEKTEQAPEKSCSEPGEEDIQNKKSGPADPLGDSDDLVGPRGMGRSDKPVRDAGGNGSGSSGACERLSDEPDSAGDDDR